MTPTQRDLILAALGLRPRNGRMPRWSSQNEYAALWPEIVEWEAMIGLGLADLDEHPNHYLFRVTRAGAEAAGVLERCRVEDVER